MVEVILNTHADGQWLTARLSSPLYLQTSGVLNLLQTSWWRWWREGSDGQAVSFWWTGTPPTPWGTVKEGFLKILSYFSWISCLLLFFREREAEESDGPVVCPCVWSPPKQAEAAGQRAPPKGDLLLRGSQLWRRGQRWVHPQTCAGEVLVLHLDHS